MEVINGLYRQFIHEPSLYAVNEHFEHVQYSFEGGVRQLFASLLRFTNMMPSPPDVYTFRRRLMISLPSNIRQEITRMGLTAEVSTVNDIMQHALIVEKGIRAERYYSQQRQDHISRLRKSSKENAKAAKKKRSPSPRKFKKVQGECHSTRPNPSYKKFKQIHDQPKKDRPSSGHKPSRPNHSKDKDKSNSKVPTCYACRKEGHYFNDPSCPDYGKRNPGEKLYHIMDDNSPANLVSEHEFSEEESHMDVGNPPDWTCFSEDEPESPSGHQSANDSDAEDCVVNILLTSEDFVSTEELSKIVDEALTLDPLNPKDRQQILEVNELAEDSNLKISIEEAIRATSEFYKKKTKDITSPSVADIPQLHAQWMESCHDIMGGIPEELPPL
ncbi:hypothetical protein EV421DRAFT_2033557 [Armillaria borealis]|uniref:CCHC-type domain-containing protein n=1 Tax=Armillaria borealis TaxID=47425 RepID=A0AA39JQP8_9AGAR|nr:hypothetical protein EV421DRAFT_2033557 [Armillaria borealis]